MAFLQQILKLGETSIKLLNDNSKLKEEIGISGQEIIIINNSIVELKNKLNSKGVTQIVFLSMKKITPFYSCRKHYVIRAASGGRDIGSIL